MLQARGDPLGAGVHHCRITLVAAGAAAACLENPQLAAGAADLPASRGRRLPRPQRPLAPAADPGLRADQPGPAAARACPLGCLAAVPVVTPAAAAVPVQLAWPAAVTAADPRAAHSRRIQRPRPARAAGPRARSRRAAA